MEGLRVFAIWLFLYGTVGALCQLRNPAITENPEPPRGINIKELVDEVFHQVDQQEIVKETSKKRVVRYTAEPDWHHLPTTEELQRAEDRRLRHIAESTRTAAVQQEASRRLRMEEERRRAGELEMAERIRNVEQRRRNNSH